MPAQLLLNEQIADAIADAARRGVPLETAAQAAGVSPSSAYEWLHVAERGTWRDGTPLTDESRAIILRFSEKYSRARAEHMALMVQRIHDAALTENRNTGVPEWRAADALLSKHPVYRKLWHEERHTVAEGEQTIRHEWTLVKQMSPAELEAAYDALEALPQPDGQG